VKPDGPGDGLRLSRRELLGTLAGAAGFAACRRVPYDRSEFSVPDRSAVALFPAADYSRDFERIVGEGLRTLAVDVRGRRVLLKPNLVEYETGTAINTHPLLVAGAAAAMRTAGAREVIVAEGPGHRRDMEYLLAATGLYQHLMDARIRFVDLNHDDVREVPLRSRFMGVRTVMLPVEVLQSDFVVSMPKLKTHHWAGMTAGMKNLFGVVPGAIYGWPKNPLHLWGIHNAVLDLTATVRPSLSIVDAVTAMEGDGPIMGRPRALGFVGMSTDVVALDATCARVIGIDPGKVPYLAAATFLGHHDDDRIDQRGERPDRYRTEFELIDLMKELRLRA
jgi:uncharacterized protein (DUF362 family)